jgi:hypothetical protein
MNKLIKTSIILLSFTIFSCQATNTPNTPSGTGANSGSGEFKFVGQTVDKASSGANITTDGKNDFQFSYVHNFSSEVELKEVTISRIENGKPYGLAGWSTSPTRTYWALGVEVDGKMLNQGKTLSLGKLSGNKTFNLYGSEAGAESFNLKNAGTEYQLDFKYMVNDKEETITKMFKF